MVAKTTKAFFSYLQKNEYLPQKVNIRFRLSHDFILLFLPHHHLCAQLYAASHFFPLQQAL